jgi:hypothetical protein
MTRIPKVAAIALALGLTPAAWSAGNMSQAQQQYKQDQAYCRSGQSQQDRATCMKEAAAAYAEASRGTLEGNGSTSAMGASAEDGKAKVSKTAKKSSKKSKKATARTAQPAA